MSKKYIVTGPGRTGTHWVVGLIKHVLDIKEQYGIVGFVASRWDMSHPDLVRWSQETPAVLHTNDCTPCFHISKELRDQTMLINVFRHDVFAAAVSYFVAHHTDEWHFYTDRPHTDFPLLEIPVLPFLKLANDYHVWMETMRLHGPGCYGKYAELWYEDLLEIQDHRKFISELIGVKDRSAKPMIWPHRNHRDYRLMVSNYDLLQTKYQKMMAIRVPAPRAFGGESHEMLLTEEQLKII